jgi:hypothetical protein
MEQPSTSTEVYSDAKCIYNYCPHPEICKENGCQHPIETQPVPPKECC